MSFLDYGLTFMKLETDEMSNKLSPVHNALQFLHGLLSSIKTLNYLTL